MEFQEILVAADIIKTVAVTPTSESVAVLAAIVVIRTFLSWSLELEISGRWPWQKSRDSEAAPPTGATSTTGASTRCGRRLDHAARLSHPKRTPRRTPGMHTAPLLATGFLIRATRALRRSDWSPARPAATGQSAP